MSSKTYAIAEAFDTLRTFCDPRGHGVLDALERVCITETAMLDGALEAMRDLPSDRVRVIPLLRDHSVRVPNEPS